MSRISVKCGRYKKTLRFYLPSPAKNPATLPERGVEFSDETPERDWEYLSDTGRQMMKALSGVLSGRDEYTMVYGSYLEISLYSVGRWSTVFPEVINVFAGWMGSPLLGVDTAPDCEEVLRPWIEGLVRSLGR